MPEKNITELINNLENIPSMPTILSEALNTIDSPKANFLKLAEIISKDFSLSSQVLKLVNSTYYGFPGQITTIDKAMALLGFDTIKTLILSVVVKPMIMTHSGKALWEHSIRCAVACQIMSKSLGFGDPNGAFVMGLLHDLGKIVLEIANKDSVKDVNNLVHAGTDILEAETKYFGFNHVDAGKALASKWKLPLIIITAISYHHNPLASQSKMLSSLIYVADRVCIEPLKYPILDPDIVDSFDFEVPDPMELREQVFEVSNHIINNLS